MGFWVPRVLKLLYSCWFTFLRGTSTWLNLFSLVCSFGTGYFWIGEPLNCFVLLVRRVLGFGSFRFERTECYQIKAKSVTFVFLLDLCPFFNVRIRLSLNLRFDRVLIVVIMSRIKIAFYFHWNLFVEEKSYYFYF